MRELTQSASSSSFQLPASSFQQKRTPEAGSWKLAAEEVRVVGAGLSGLATAWYLTEGGARVHVIEAAGSAGGLIHTLRTPEGLVETAAPAFTSSDRVLALFSAAGVEACVPNPAFEEAIHLPRQGVLGAGRSRRSKRRPRCCGSGPRGSRDATGREGRKVSAEWGSRVLGRGGVEWLLAPAAQGSTPRHRTRSRRRPSSAGGAGAAPRLSPRRGMQELVDGLVKHWAGVASVSRSTNGSPRWTRACPPRSAPKRRLPRACSDRTRRDSPQRSTGSAWCRWSPSRHSSSRQLNDLRGSGVLFPRSSKVGALGVLFNTDVFPERSHLRSETWIYPSIAPLDQGEQRCVARIPHPSSAHSASGIDERSSTPARG